MLDIHSHILPAIDDGAKNVETSVQLLKLMRDQGITHVITTPHFDLISQNVDDFRKKVSHAYKELDAACENLDLPKVGVGSEVFYFPGIGKSETVYDLTLCGSKYILLELPNEKISNDILADIEHLRHRLNLIPIIAHIERYSSELGFKKLLKLVAEGEAYAQINAASLIDSPHKKTVLKLIKRGYISFIATDTHSLNKRPPKMGEALSEIERVFGSNYKNMFVHNSEKLCKEIFRVYGDINNEE